MTDTEHEPKDPSLRRLVMQDLRHSDLRRTLGQDFRELYLFYLDDARRERLAGMGRVKRTIWMLGWLFKGLLLKLSPTRRLMLVAALLCWFFLQEWTFSGESNTLTLNFRFVAFVLVLIVLMLELKDKLLAHDEIQVARQVQLELLPRQDPRPDGWELWSFMKPANHVGGDLVDYVDLGSGRLGITLGDVAGKGLGAALLMAKLQATLRALAPTCGSLADLGRDLNLILHRDGLPNRFATLFYLEVQRGSGTARYLNAGHNPVYLLRSGGSRAEKLEASGLPLGMLEPATYEEGRIDLSPGDLIVAYSDGLTEAENADGKEFGNGRLEALLGTLAGRSSEAAGGLIIEEVTRFMGERKPMDDLSLVLARRTDGRG